MLLTVVLFSYNQSKFVGAAIDSLLSQDCLDYELLILDDASSDGTQEVIRQRLLQKTNPRPIVRCILNDYNCGLAAQVNRAFRETRTDIVILAAGDDMSFPDRVSYTWEQMSRDPSIVMLNLDQTVIDDGDFELPQLPETGDRPQRSVSLNMLMERSNSHLSGAARSYRKAVWGEFGPLNEACPTEDSTLLLRAALLGRVVAVDKPGIKYRIHKMNLSSVSRFHRISAIRIGLQYRHDAKTARTKGLLRQGQYFRLNLWIASTVTRKGYRRTRYLARRFARDLLSWRRWNMYRGVFRIHLRRARRSAR